MAQNITLLGASYSEVPAVTLPKTGGGTARFDDASITTATASDVASGKVFLASDGTITTGTASGGSAVIEALSVTQNGTYTAPTGVDGYSPVTVNVSGGGEDKLHERLLNTLSGIVSYSDVTIIPSYAFANCSRIEGVDFPNVTTIYTSAFANCSHIETANFPKADYIYTGAFWACKSLITASFPSATSISTSAFAYCSNLTEANFPVLKSVAAQGFAFCTNLETANFPSATTIASSAFSSCKYLIDISVPKVLYVSTNAFMMCSTLQTISLPSLSRMSSNVFNGCTKLESVYLLGSSVASGATNMFINTPIAVSTYLGYFGSIYVRTSLLASWQVKAQWSTYSARMVGLTDEQIAALG